MGFHNLGLPNTHQAVQNFYKLNNCAWYYFGMFVSLLETTRSWLDIMLKDY